MIVSKKNCMYTSKRKLIHGRGFVDSLSGIGNYISQNKDLLAKPMLSAVGNIGALALTEGSKAIIKKLINKAQSNNNLTPESIEILNSLKTGNGIKKF